MVLVLLLLLLVFVFLVLSLLSLVLFLLAYSEVFVVVEDDILQEETSSCLFYVFYPRVSVELELDCLNDVNYGST